MRLPRIASSPGRENTASRAARSDSGRSKWDAADWAGDPPDPQCRCCRDADAARRAFRFRSDGREWFGLLARGEVPGARDWGLGARERARVVARTFDRCSRSGAADARVAPGSHSCLVRFHDLRYLLPFCQQAAQIGAALLEKLGKPHGFFGADKIPQIDFIRRTLL